MNDLNVDGQFQNIRRQISRTSSQRSADRLNSNLNTNPNQKDQAGPDVYQVHGLRIGRVGSVQLSAHDLHPGLIEQAPISNFIQDVEQKVPVEQVEQNISEKLQSIKLQNYFQMCKDIQFIQMLGNPSYVVELYIRGYLFSKQFKQYIKGLRCFLKRPELMRLIKYGQGLYSLNLLLKKGFIESLDNFEFRSKFIVNSLKLNQSFKNDKTPWRNQDINTIVPDKQQ